MNKILLASHGILAEAFLQSIEMIMGKVEGVRALCGYLNPEEDFPEVVKQTVKDIPDGEKLIVLTDIPCGSVNNEFMKYRNKLYLVAGVNLPLVLEIVSNIECVDVEQMIRKCVSHVSEYTVFCNDLQLDEQENDSKDEF